MPYVWICIICYAVTFGGVFVFVMNNMAAQVRTLIARGTPEPMIADFRREVFPKTCLGLIWATAVIGSLVAGLMSGFYALVSR